jgi:hypothetical protein
MIAQETGTYDIIYDFMYDIIVFCMISYMILYDIIYDIIYDITHDISDYLVPFQPLIFHRHNPPMPSIANMTMVMVLMKL